MFAALTHLVWQVKRDKWAPKGDGSIHGEDLKMTISCVHFPKIHGIYRYTKDSALLIASMAGAYRGIPGEKTPSSWKMGWTSHEIDSKNWFENHWENNLETKGIFQQAKKNAYQRGKTRVIHEISQQFQKIKSSRHRFAHKKQHLEVCHINLDEPNPSWTIPV